MSSELVLKEEYLNSEVRVYISGEVDIYTAQRFKERLYNIVENNTDKDLLIDCGELDYIDSTGLGILVGALKKARLNGRNIQLENTKDNIRKLFVITGLDRLFIIK